MNTRTHRTTRGGAALFVLAAVTLASLVAACGPVEAPVAAGAKRSIAETLKSGLTRREANGKVLYERYCLVCHGATAAGDGFNAATLTPRPTDLLQQLRSESDDHVAETIRIGSKARGHSPLCPPWGLTLDASRIEEIVLYVKTIGRQAKEPAAAGK
jgi:mono/diheme cytochrome c family protein